MNMFQYGVLVNGTELSWLDMICDYSDRPDAHSSLLFSPGLQVSFSDLLGCH
jgi:hypothetical protein